MIDKLRSLLPRSWFGDNTPVLDSVLAAFADVASFYHEVLLWVKDQARIATATGGTLDLIARDFFGRRIRRRKNQGDNAFRTTITKEIFRERATRRGVAVVLKDLTGVEPVIFEPANAGDTGGLGINWSIGSGAGLPSKYGRVGSLNYPAQAFIDATRPLGAGVLYLSGFGSARSGLGGRFAIASIKDVIGEVTDADIYQAVSDNQAEGVIGWTRIRT